ncbi:MAG: putative short-chain dehydrogenase/reductase [Frondihabitans sp.]|nr:putative short-chain dehydrogenase/reductase [Frondihabitans sp.]
MSQEPAPVLVAGGTGPLGAAIGTLLAAAGHPVALHYRSAHDRAAELVEGLPGTGHVIVRADLLESDGAERLVRDTEKSLGRPLGGVVNCAWPAHRSAPLGGPDGVDLLEPALDGLRSHLALCRAVLPALRAASGSFVFIGGALSHRLHPGLGHYSIGKAAATTATRTLALEEGPHGVRFNVIAPGRIDVGDGDLVESDPSFASLDEIGSLRRSFPALPTPLDVARVAAFLVGPDSSSVTGQVISITGGEPL